MTTEEILKEQIKELKNLLELKDKRISELESRPTYYYPSAPTYPYWPWHNNTWYSTAGMTTNLCSLTDTNALNVSAHS